MIFLEIKSYSPWKIKIMDIAIETTKSSVIPFCTKYWVTPDVFPCEYR